MRKVVPPDRAPKITPPGAGDNYLISWGAERDWESTAKMRGGYWTLRLVQNNMIAYSIVYTMAYNIAVCIMRSWTALLVCWSYLRETIEKTKNFKNLRPWRNQSQNHRENKKKLKKPKILQRSGGERGLAGWQGPMFVKSLFFFSFVLLCSQWCWLAFG